MCARPCEEACRRKEVDAPIGICYLKRVAADYRGETPPRDPAALERHDRRHRRRRRQRPDRRPQLARKGYQVEIHERYPVPAA
jgi:NADPH-dependent glutamate synthase beta subunit-like oxidoreductase